jgi:hypothetical protein
LRVLQMTSKTQDQTQIAAVLPSFGATSSSATVNQPPHIVAIHTRSTRYT